MIDRETIVERSLEAFVRQQVYVVRHYPADRVVMLDAYPTADRMMKPIGRHTYVALGYSNDDGGVSAELGSSLVKRVYTYDYYVFGETRVWGKNVANVVRFSAEAEKSINLLDPADNTTVIGNVSVLFASAQQAVTQNPRPWEQNAWITRIRLEDYYSASQGG